MNMLRSVVETVELIVQARLTPIAQLKLARVVQRRLFQVAQHQCLARSRSPKLTG